ARYRRSRKMLEALPVQSRCRPDHPSWLRSRYNHTMTTDLLSLAEDIVRRAIKAGASDADALAVDRRGIEVSIRAGNIEKLERAEARDVGLRVFIGRASAMIAGSVLDGAGLDRPAEL